MALSAASSYTLDLLSRFSCRLPNTLPERKKKINHKSVSSLDNAVLLVSSHLLTYIGAEQPFVELGGIAGC